MGQRRGEEVEEAGEGGDFFFFCGRTHTGAQNLPGVALFRLLQVEDVTVLEVLPPVLLLLTFDL